MKISKHTHYPERALVFDKKDATVSYSPDAFRDSYGQTVTSHLGSRLQGESLTALYDMASEALGPESAVALAGEAMITLASQKDMSDADTGMLRNVQAERVGETPNQTTIYLGPDELTDYGFATTQSVVLPQGFEPLIGHASGDFIIGHELCHVENKDVVKKFGRKVLVESLQDALLKVQAHETLVVLERKMELEADRHGVLYAREQGHSKARVKAAVSQFFSVTEAGGSDSHPARALRLANLDKALESEG